MAGGEVVYPEWKKILWRGLRTAVSSGIGAALVLGLDFSDPWEAVRLGGSAFISGFLVSLGLVLRDEFGNKRTQDTLIDKIPI